MNGKILEILETLESKRNPKDEMAERILSRPNNDIHRVEIVNREDVDLHPRSFMVVVHYHSNWALVAEFFTVVRVHSKEG